MPLGPEHEEGETSLFTKTEVDVKRNCEEEVFGLFTKTNRREKKDTILVEEEALLIFTKAKTKRERSNLKRTQSKDGRCLSTSTICT